MSKIPKYVATSQDEEIYLYGHGDTPELALDDYVNGGDFETYCDQHMFSKGEPVEVEIWTAIDSKQSEYEEGEYPDNWKWCLDRRIRVENVNAS